MTSLLFAGGIGFCLALGVLKFYSRFKQTKQCFLPLKSLAVSSLPVHSAPSPSLLSEPFRFGDLATLSSRVSEILKATRIIAETSSTVLIEGESGTGKERIAKLIHNYGCRSTQPFIAVHAAALPENLLEAELFGHEKGAYTGAHQQRKGRFELAHKGTIFWMKLRSCLLICK